MALCRWWGVARHFNYLGEITQALALALPSLLIGCQRTTATTTTAAVIATTGIISSSPLNGSLGALINQTVIWLAPLAPYLSLLYPLYYVLLFVPRQLDDDEVCARKYGKDWAEYVRTVPWRICPGVW